MQTRKRIRLRLVLPLVALVIVAVVHGSIWWSGVRAARARFPQYQGTAIIGNGRLLAPVDHYGTIIGLFWPHTGRYQNVYNPHIWAAKPGSTPPSTGVFLGMMQHGRIRWLRDARAVHQEYRANSNILVTDYTISGGRNVRVEDWVLPDTDVLVRRISSRMITTADRFSIVAYQNLDLGGRRGRDTATYTDGLLVHYRTSPDVAVAVGATAPPRIRDIAHPDTFGTLREKTFSPRTRSRGDVATAACWPFGGDLTIVYSIADQRDKALRQARVALAEPVDELAKRTGEYWHKWLASGKHTEGMPARMEKLYTRSLLVLKLLQDRETGGIAGGARSYWAYCWPRDGVYAAAAFDLAGHHREAEKLYAFLVRTQRPDGMWDARYDVDGRRVADKRAPQIDSAGYFPWGVWLHMRTTNRTRFARTLYPSVKRSADYVLDHLDYKTGLPGPSSDYWESSKHLTFYISNAIVCWAGLTCAAELATEFGKRKDANAYSMGASRIRRGLGLYLADGQKLMRAVEGFRGADSAVAWAVSPFGMLPPNDQRVYTSIKRIELGTTSKRGGITPGEDWRDRDPWVHETLFLALYYATRGDSAQADQYLEWARRMATEANTLPERISVDTGFPSSTTPLAWAHAEFILAAAERWSAGIPKPREDAGTR